MADLGRVVRFALNGLVATGVHFSVLWANLNVFHFTSAGLANLVAAAFGITCSFLGNRYFVFRTRDTSLVAQLAKFGVLYGLLAAMHGAVMFCWTDVFRLDYRIGFLGATGLQVLLSYWGSKRLVFVS